MAADSLMLAGKTLYLTDGDGNQILQVPPGMVAQIQQMMSGGNGAGMLGTLGDGVELGASVIEALSIQDDVDDSRDALAKLYNARQVKYQVINQLFSTPVTINGRPVTLAQAERAVDVQQDKVDRAQNRAFQKSIGALWGQVFGSGARLLGRLKGGAADMFGSMSGGSGIAGMLFAGGAGALLGQMFSRRERTDRDEDDASNVPPLE